MPHLFSSLRVARVQLLNRIVFASHAQDLVDTTGFVAPSLASYYLRRARGGAGLIVPQPAFVFPPAFDQPHSHLGLYHDGQIAPLAAFVRECHDIGSRVLLPLECPLPAPDTPIEQLNALREQWMQAGWRALAARCDGILLSAADGGALHTLLSPLRNTRTDGYGKDLDGRLRLSLELVEGLRSWFGKRLLIAFRLNADEMTAGGMTIQDTRVIARRLANAGVDLLDITLLETSGVSIARFPGWRVPLAAAIKRVLPEVPIMTSGSLGDPTLADGVIREGSADLVALGHSLRADPDWPQHTRSLLSQTAMQTSEGHGLNELLFGEE